MDISSIDPTIAQLGVRLADAMVRNTANTVFDTMRTLKGKRTDQEKISELERIIYDLIEDKSELAAIAQAYKEQLVAQQISDEQIQYIIDTVIPVLEGVIDNMAETMDEAEADKLQSTIDALTPILSVKTLTVLQLLGFNYKRAIGEPLTMLIQRLITSRSPLDKPTELEVKRFEAAFSTELARVAQDEEATARWERLRDFRRSDS